MKKIRFQFRVYHSIQGVVSFLSVSLWRLPYLLKTRHIMPSKARVVLEGRAASEKLQFEATIYTGRQFVGFRPGRLRWAWLRRVRFFFKWFGSQNDYGFTGYGAPYPRPHLWKTRFGFSTAWGLACIVEDGLTDDVCHPFEWLEGTAESALPGGGFLDSSHENKMLQL